MSPSDVSEKLDRNGRLSVSGPRRRRNAAPNGCWSLAEVIGGRLILMKIRTDAQPKQFESRSHPRGNASYVRATQRYGRGLVQEGSFVEANTSLANERQL